MPLLPKNGSDPITGLLQSVLTRDEQQRTIERLLARRQEIDGVLKQLGYGAGTVKAPVDPNARPCRVCHELGHDARHHRAENLKAIARGRKARK